MCILPLYFMKSEDGNLYDTRKPGWGLAPIRSDYARTHETIRTGAEYRETLRAGPFAWPGGYPMILVLSDGELLCFDCGRSEARHVIRAIRDRSSDGWRVIGAAVHWEGEPEQCAHCGRGIPSAYGSNEGE